MFETCMVESAGQLKSHNRKWTTAGAVLIEGALLTAGVLAAMLSTEAIKTTPRISSVFIPISTPIVRTEHIAAAGGGGGGQAFVQPTHIPTAIPSGGRTHLIGRDSGDPKLPDCPDCSGFGPVNGDGLKGLYVAPVPPVVHPQRLRVSSVDPARLMKRVTPLYPKMAIPLRLPLTTVMLHAVIARDGTIENLAVVSGHPMFNQAALDAVRQWVYRPTYLGGEPVEVETTITVNFTMGQ